MNALNFPSTQTNYPLTIEGLDLLQKAINLAAQAVLTGAPSTGCYIVSGCTGTQEISSGVLLIYGELYVLEASNADKYITISSTPQDVTVGSVTYSSARTIKTATFQPKNYGTGTSYEWSSFVRINSNVDLYSLIRNNIDKNNANTANYLVPQGAIVMWSGDPDNVPLGWGLCDGWHYNPSNSADKIYILPEGDTTHTYQTPNLQGKFVVGFWNQTDTTPDATLYPGRTNYGAIGNVGGEITTKNVVAHVHSYISDDEITRTGIKDYLPWMTKQYSNHTLDGNSPASWSGDFRSVNYDNYLGFYSTSQAMKIDQNNNITHSCEEAQELENRPPYYVLAYIIKIH